MSADGFGADPDLLRDHARRLDETVVRRLRTASGAASPLDRDAYGLIGQAFTVQVSGSAQTCSAVVSGLAARGERFRDGVRACADGYGRTDRQVGSLFGPSR